jgi:hypothetical protein
MNKRNVATVLWFVAGWSGGGLVAGLLGLPSILSLVPGALAAGIVWWDPAGALWSGQAAKRRIMPINAFAKSLADDAGAAEVDRAGS